MVKKIPLIFLLIFGLALISDADQELDSASDDKVDLILLPTVDEDDMASDSAVLLPTQQSVKAYIGTFAQPLDADLTAVAALTTDPYGLALLEYADEATIKAALNLEANTDFYAPAGTDVPATDGGTGLSAITDGAVMLGSDTGAVTPLVITGDGQMIVGDGAGDPTVESGAPLRTSIGVGTTDPVAVYSSTAAHYDTCFADVPTDYVFGQVVCADGATWNPSGQDWTGFTDTEKKHWVSMIAPVAADCVANGNPVACCTDAATGATCPDPATWTVHKDIIGNVYYSGSTVGVTYLTSSRPLTEAEMSGGIIYATGAHTAEMLPVFDGANFSIIVIGDYVVSVDPADPEDEDLIILDGDTTLGDGDKATSPGNSGDMAVFTYYTAIGFFCKSNGWSDGG